jgi:ornithine cyclodeaminase
MRIFDAAASERLLPYPALRDAIAAALCERRAGRVQVPDRTAIALPDEGWLLLMGGASTTTAVTKVVTVHPHARERRVQSDVILMDARDGTRLAMLDGEILTERRTAALSLLAADRLAPNPKADLLLIGAGAQARAHLEAFREGLGTQRVWIYSRSAPRRDDLLRLAVAWGMEAEPLADPHTPLREPLLIVTATNSNEPVLLQPPAPGSFIAAVGAFRPTMAELAPAVLVGADLVVDTLEGAKREAGDLLQAGVDWSSVSALQARLEGVRPDRTVVFKSVGHGIFDLAAATLARARMPQEADDDASEG